MTFSNRFYYLLIALALSSGFLFPRQHNPKTETGPLPNDWFFYQRAYPEGRINYQLYVESMKEALVHKEQQSKESTWEQAGPYNITGRLSDVESHECGPEVYLGTASGGIFKGSVSSNEWTPIFDEAMSLSIGDIAIAPSDCNILYVGTGEANCGGGSQTYDGVGIYKSDDGGENWEHLGLEEGRNVGRIAIHPEDPNTAYVAAMGSLFADSPDRGIYKTTNGGASWEQVLFVSDSTGGIDIVIHPTDPDILYAAMWERVRRPNRRSYGGTSCGLYKTTDAGENWEELTNGLPSPSAYVGRIGIDISVSDPDILYAIYADNIGYFDGVYKTEDGGASWNQTNDGALSNCYQSYGWWFGRIKVDPVDPDIAYVIGFDLYKTSNGGNSWNNISEYETHVDQHALYIDPIDHDSIFLGNDGGFYVSADGGNNWAWLNAMPSTQFYTCEIDEQYPERLYGGTQDNGTNRTLTGSTDDWASIYGGDGFYVLVDPTNNNYVYAEYQYGGLGRSTNGGWSFDGATNGISSSDRKNWSTPVVFDPSNPEILYYGSDRMYRSTNRAASWTAISGDLTNGPGVNLTYGTLTTISVSPVDPEIIYCGSDDGNVWVSTNGGLVWDPINDGLPDRWVTRVAADPVEEQTVYVTFSGYRWDEFLPHIFRSEDYGQTWTDISSDLPEIPVNDVIVDPGDNTTLYVATDAGVYRSNNLGESWEMMGSNLPLVPVNDLDLHNETRTLVAATFGRSMFTYDLFQDTTTTSVRNSRLEEKQLKASVSPNPVIPSTQVHIDSWKNQQVQLYLTTLEGKAAGPKISVQLQQGRNSVPLSRMEGEQLSNGVFLLVVEWGTTCETIKIVR